MFQFIIWIVTAPFRFVIWLFKTWKWYIACGILAVITIAGVVIFMVATAKKPAAITTTTTQAPTIPNDIQGAIYGADPFPLLLRGECDHLDAEGKCLGHEILEEAEKE